MPDLDAIDAAIERALGDAPPRVAQMMASFLKDMRWFCGEEDATIEEWVVMADFVQASLSK
jgi:hypothetical protein